MKHNYISTIFMTGLCLVLGRLSTSAQNASQVIYTPEDSLEIVSLLREDVGDNDVLYYARHFIGRPYVAHTLEISDDEKLVVNLHGLDCTTYVETVCALVLTKRQKSDKFADYCRNLERLRYWGGVRNGYVSRLHYFSWWMRDNQSRGIVAEVYDSTLFKGKFIVNNFYMSKYPERYKFLKGNSKRRWKIRLLENQNNGCQKMYLQENDTGYGRERLSCVRDGDIVAVVTEKRGLDYSHLGFAVWGRDGKLHLLNASSIYHKVVEDCNTLQQYLARSRTAVGVQFLRLCNKKNEIIPKE